MTVSIDKNKEQLLVAIEQNEIRGRVMSGIVDVIVTKVADSYMQKYGNDIINEISNDPEIRMIIKSIITERCANQSIDSGVRDS